MSGNRQPQQESCLSPLPLAIIVLALILISGTPTAAIVTPAAPIPISFPLAITIVQATFLLPLRLPLLSHSTV
jgi:hypothetical protein